MKRVVEYQPIVDEFMRSEYQRPLVFRSQSGRNQHKITLADLAALHMPDGTALEVEYYDSTGYHRALVTGAWESEDGSVVLNAGQDVTILDRSEQG